MNWNKVIPKAIPMKRKETNREFKIEPKEDVRKISKLFREKVEADRKRLGLS